MNIELKIDVDDSKKLMKKVDDIFRSATEKCGITWMNATKQILQNKGVVNTGEFINSIHYEITKRKDTYTMTGMDAVKYGKFIEFGTVEHFVPFYKWTGAGYDTSQPILAEWAKKVLGMTEEEMLSRGGMKVSNTETNAFELGLLHLKHVHQKIFEDEFKKSMK